MRDIGFITDEGDKGSRDLLAQEAVPVNTSEPRMLFDLLSPALSP